MVWIHNNKKMKLAFYLYLIFGYLPLSESASTDPLPVGALPLKLPVIGSTGGHTISIIKRYPYTTMNSAMAASRNSADACNTSKMCCVVHIRIMFHNCSP
jgi:hypothetical protein